MNRVIAVLFATLFGVAHATEEPAYQVVQQLDGAEAALGSAVQSANFSNPDADLAAAARGARGERAAAGAHADIDLLRRAEPSTFAAVRGCLQAAARGISAKRQLRGSSPGHMRALRLHVQGNRRGVLLRRHVRHQQRLLRGLRRHV